MAASHACASCGLELARTRAIYDAELRLRVVVCPRCGTASARGRPEIVVLWRGVRSAVVSGLTILVQVAIGVGLVVAVVTPVALLETQRVNDWRLGLSETLRAAAGRTLADASGDPGAAGRLAVWAAMFVCASVGSGAWFAAGLAHLRRRWMLFAGWGAVLAFALVLGPALTGDWGARIARGPLLVVERLAAVPASLLLAAAGLPIGRSIGRSWGQTRRLRTWKWRRAQRRLRESVR